VPFFAIIGFLVKP
jgi:hypothetical protein